jgi:hypothetical protein
MTKNELAELGLTPEDVLNKLTDRLAEQLLGTSEDYDSDFRNRLEKAIKTRVNEVLDAAMTAHILPKITEMTEGVCLTETNRWGEKIGKTVTFVEYLTSRIDAYIREDVNHNGKTQAEDSYSWQKRSTRIAYMIHEHLQYNIERAVKQALGEVNSSVRKGLEEAVKIAIAGIKVSVDTKISS